MSSVNDDWWLGGIEDQSIKTVWGQLCKFECRLYHYWINFDLSRYDSGVVQQETILILQRCILKYLGGKSHGGLQLIFRMVHQKRVCVYVFLCMHVLFADVCIVLCIRAYICVRALCVLVLREGSWAQCLIHGRCVCFSDFSATFLLFFLSQLSELLCLSLHGCFLFCSWPSSFVFLPILLSQNDLCLGHCLKPPSIKQTLPFGTYY